MNEKIRTKEYFESTPLTNRPLEAYRTLLDLKLEDLANKNILDLGSGESEEFRQGIKRGHIQAKVFSVNPLMGPNTPAAKAARSMSQKENVVAAIAQELSFKDKSFDLVLSLAGIPLWLSEDDHNYERAFSEIDRVLKNRGVAKLFPIWEKDNPFLEKQLKQLEAEGYEILWQDIDEETGKRFSLNSAFSLTLKKL